MGDKIGFEFLSQKITFFAKINLLAEALKDDASPTPGYIYPEIAKISHESTSHSHDLADFLIDQLSSPSAHVKYKVLKIMKFVTLIGHQDFRGRLRKFSSHPLSEATKFGGAPDPVYGISLYHNVRKEAQELTELLYNVEEQTLATDKIRTEVVPSGMGSSVGGKMEGFGNTVSRPSTNPSQSLVRGVQKLAEKVLGPGTSGHGFDSYAAATDSVFGQNYEPVQIAVEPGLEREVSDEVSATKSVKESAMTSSQYVFRPGVAGGGWAEDGEGREVVNIQPTSSPQTHNQATPQITGSQSERQSTEMETKEICDEKILLEDILQSECPTQSQLNLWVQRCESMNLTVLLDLLNQQMLQPESEDSRLKCLLLCESLIRTDYVQRDVTLRHCNTGLQRCLDAEITCATHIKASKIMKILDITQTTKDVSLSDHTRNSE